MKKNAIITLVGDVQKILLRECTIQPKTKTPPFGFLNIYAVREKDVFKYLEVSLKIVAKGGDVEQLIEHPDKFFISLNGEQHLPTELLIRQIQMLNYGYNCGTVTEEEIEIIREFNVTNTSLENKEPIFITEDFMAQHLGKSYPLNDNMIGATQMAYAATLDELNAIVEQLK